MNTSAMTLMLAGSILLSACTPTRINPKVELPIVAGWQGAQGVERISDPVALAAWWRKFKDPVLDDLIGRALAANHDWRIAKTRVREALSMVTVAESALYPTLELSGSGGREKRIDRIVGVPGPRGIELITPTADAITGGLTARWEIDLFGGRQLDAEAAKAQATGSREAAQAVRVGLLAQVASHYLELRGCQQRTDLLRQHIDLQKRRLQVLEALYRAGLVRDSDVSRQRTLLHTTEATLSPLTQASANLIHRLSVLAGEPPARLYPLLDRPAPLPALPPKLPGVLPAALLDRRPDLRLAKARLDAAAASLGAARANLYPKIVLQANAGVGALAVGGFPSLAETVYALGSGLSAPLFNAGRIRAFIVAADARLNQAATAYEQAFLIALEDVENAYVAHRSSQDRLDRLRQGEAAASASVRDTDAFHARGATDLLSVIDAQRTLLEVSDARSQAATALAVSIVSLYRAMGGGWNPDLIDQHP